MTQWEKDCLSCQNIQGKVRLHKAPRIIETKYWIVEHVGSVHIKGWLVVVIKRHCTAMHDLTEEEMVEFGKLAKVACQGLHTILKTEKEYIMQYSEGKGFAHLHIHLVAKVLPWPDNLRGPRVMTAMEEKIDEKFVDEEVTPLALKIREYLLKHLPPELIVK
jgi:diadenosine tetraphosphate (Ap4A) HIT family hydrolase